MSKLYDVVYFTGRKYTDKEGIEREDSVKMGAVIRNKNGNETLILDSIPVGFKGMANLFKPKADNAGTEQNKPAPKNNLADDEIPF